jgi:hypothetical protein
VSELRRRRLLRSRTAGFATLLAVITATTALAAVVGLGLPGTTAFFSNQQPAAANLGAGRIFRANRDTIAWTVTDKSSGSSTDGSAGFAYAGDSRYFATVAWPAAFDSARYIELDLNSPLPAGLTVSSGQLSLRFAGDSAGASVCVYVELRRISSGALLSSHGSSGSPLGCTTGTTYATLTPLLSAVTDTNFGNDLRVRIYGRDTGASGPIRLDQVVVSGSTPYASFTLYPLLTRDVHDGRTDLIRWGLAGS